MTQLSNRVAVITGASSGIGRATAKLLAERGAKVAVLARRGDMLEQLVAEIRAAGGTAMALTVDVTDQASIDNAAATIEQNWGPANLVFNNAGVMLPASIEARETAPWEQQIDLNVTGATRVISAFVPQLLKSAEAGATVDLINTSSIAAQNIYPYFAVYSATKAYVSHMTRHLRAELGPKNVRVSVIEPGCTDTELQGHFQFPGAIAWLEGARQTITFLKPEDVAEVVGFLATQPKHVNLQQVVVMPTNQAS
ncbi:SDR family oxidoreductase [Rugamonas aquatica]|uniref:SDR family NAD(P)-dependent oxidoreductase n=1 Tax=Rugamonas aquatica TaxID=2743357 RepID=A0A6A7N870_9BURK|nr:SDR family oxidoreductase [Rugamonas aquatica]MQA41062.1 SDR family NAD(P)-dependent oxidoreductase [Rugamonas aquatica]